MYFMLCVFLKQKTAYEMRIRYWSSDVCPSDLLGHRLGAAALRIGLAVARRAIAGHREAAVGAVDAHHRGVAARPRHGVGHDHVVVLLPHPALGAEVGARHQALQRSEEHTSALQSLMRISYAVFCLKKTAHRKTPQSKKKNT